MGLLSVLIYIGIRIIISSASQDKAKYKQRLIDWLVAFCLLFFMHYIMVATVYIVDQINDMIEPSIKSEEGIDLDAKHGWVKYNPVSQRTFAGYDVGYSYRVAETPVSGIILTNEDTDRIDEQMVNSVLSWLNSNGYSLQSGTPQKSTLAMLNASIGDKKTEWYFKDSEGNILLTLQRTYDYNNAYWHLSGGSLTGAQFTELAHAVNPSVASGVTEQINEELTRVTNSRRRRDNCIKCCNINRPKNTLLHKLCKTVYEYNTKVLHGSIWIFNIIYNTNSIYSNVYF